MHHVMRWGSVMVWVVWLGMPSVAAEVKADAVVKVFVNKNSMDYRNPWQSHGGRMATGSGCIISDNRILTNAHVVNDHTFLQVRKESDPKKYTATVEAIGQDYDLAILRVQDPEFFQGVSALEFGGLPNLQDAVTVFGYPVGGEQLSITAGVVSRVEVIPYTHSGRELLSIQIDAAINPGNSGGPVLKDGKLIGVAMQAIPSSENIGYMIPVPVITHFLEEVARGTSAGVPILGIHIRNTENKGLRRYYGIPKAEGGLVVEHVAPFSSADGQLQEGDVLLSVDGVPVSADGTVPFRKNERLNMSFVVSSKHVGDAMTLTYLRGGTISTLEIVLKRPQNLVSPTHAQLKPSYYIYGGLVFTVLSRDLMNEWKIFMSPLEFLYWDRGVGGLNEERKKEVVVLSEVLPDEVNVGYHGYLFEIITKVNGNEFGSLQEFVTLVEANTDEYVIFENEYKKQIIIDVKDAARTSDAILKRNHISSRSSEDVSLWLNQ